MNNEKIFEMLLASDPEMRELGKTLISSLSDLDYNQIRDEFERRRKVECLPICVYDVFFYENIRRSQK
jgi:hypothetical protein